MDLASVVTELEQQSMTALRTLGDVEPQVVGALAPQRLGADLVCWPAQALGRIRIVRRAANVLFVTEGLSYPLDPSLHDPDRASLGFELGMELTPVGAPSSEELSQAWAVPALLWLAACYLQDNFQLLELIDNFGLATQILPPDPNLQAWHLDDGTVGALAGMPLSPGINVGINVGMNFGRNAQLLLGQVQGHESRLVMLTGITPDECNWARGVHDGSRSIALAMALWAKGNAHRTIPNRPSALREALSFEN
jgi:hypothetical protein